MNENDYGRPGPGKRQENGASSEGIDPRVRQWLSSLDPAESDPAYWLRFQQAVMRRASGELARRRAMADITVNDVVSGWARTVVPSALLAAAAAAIFLLQPLKSPVVAGTAEQLLHVEEVLAEGGGEPIPAVLADEALPGAMPTGVMFASEIF